MPESLNNDDIRIGLFHDYEVRCWVNCNYVMNCLEEGTDELLLKKQVGSFQYLPNEHQEWFWKEFNRYFAQNAQDDCLKLMYETNIADFADLEGMYEVLVDCWDASFDELEEHWFSCGREATWLRAVEDWKSDNKSE